MDNGGAATMEVGVFTSSANLLITDVVDLVRVAGGTKLCELLIWNGDHDTGATLQVNIGYRKCNTGGVLADNLTFFAAASTQFQAAVAGSAPTRFAFVPLTFNEDVFITLTVSASAAGVAGNPTITGLASGIARGIK
jgi:hypothetical protein